MQGPPHTFKVVDEIWRVLEAASVAAVVIGPDGGRRVTPEARRLLGALADEPSLERSTQELGLELRCLQLRDGTSVALLRDVRTPERVLRIALHDLRSPIANARTWAALLLRGKLPPERVKPTIESLARSLDRGLALTSAYLLDELARLRPTPAERQPTEVGALLDRVFASRRAMASERGIKLEWAAVEARAEVEAEALSEAVGAVLDFALARTPPEGAIRAHIEDGASQLTIVIHDSGPTPAPNELDFDRDTRIVADNRLQPALGLHLARAQLAAHGGHLELKPQPRGATWRLVLLKTS